MALEDLFFTLIDYTFLINLNIRKSIYISDVKGAKLPKNDQNKAPSHVTIKLSVFEYLLKSYEREGGISGLGAGSAAYIEQIWYNCSSRL